MNFLNQLIERFSPPPDIEKFYNMEQWHKELNALDAMLLYYAVSILIFTLFIVSLLPKSVIV